MARDEKLNSGAPIPSWQAVLAATLILQAIAAFLLRLPPTLAPYLTTEAGLDAAAIGYLSAVGTLGSIGFLLAGAPLIRSVGSLRVLQIGVAVAAIGTLLFALPTPATVVLAVLAIGIGYGPSPSAGSDVLQRFAPPHRRSLVFSVKQAGVPLGGVAAGVLLPPLLESFGIGGVIACCLVLSVASMVIVQPLREAIDAARSRERLTLSQLFSPASLAAPLRAVTASPALFRLTIAGMCFSLCQGTWFAFLVTFLVVELGYGLALAGLVFAMTQVTGVIGRIVLGWLADRHGAIPVLAAAGLGGALASLVLALAQPSWSVAAMMVLAGVAGVAVSSWNGVQMAEIARLAPGEVHAVAAGATAIIFAGYLSGPVLFALLLAGGGRYAHGFLAVAVVSLVGVVLARPARV